MNRFCESDNRATLSLGCAAKKQSGAAAVEFAIVLPVLILLIYGMVVYAYAYVMQEAITFAAQEAAEAAVRVDPAQAQGAFINQVTAEAQARAAAVLAWLPAEARQKTIGNNGQSVAVVIVGNQVTVGITYNQFNETFPQLDLPLLGPVPPVPNTLTASGVVSL